MSSVGLKALTRVSSHHQRAILPKQLSEMLEEHSITDNMNAYKFVHNKCSLSSSSKMTGANSPSTAMSSQSRPPGPTCKMAKIGCICPGDVDAINSPRNAVRNELGISLCQTLHSLSHHRDRSVSDLNEQTLCCRERINSDSRSPEHNTLQHLLNRKASESVSMTTADFKKLRDCCLCDSKKPILLKGIRSSHCSPRESPKKVRFSPNLICIEFQPDNLRQGFNNQI